MNTTTIVLESLIQILEKEGVDLESIEFKLQGKDKVVPIPFTQLIALSQKELNSFENEANRLDFLITNRLRVEKWNTSPLTELYYVMDSDDVSIAQDQDSRAAIDKAIAVMDGLDNE